MRVENAKSNKVENMEKLMEQWIKKHKLKPLSASFTAEDLQELHFSFQIIDKDGSGQLDDGEIMGALKSLGMKMKRSMIQKFIHQADVTGTGELDFFEFVYLVGSTMEDSEGSMESSKDVLLPMAHLASMHRRKQLVDYIIGQSRKRMIAAELSATNVKTKSEKKRNARKSSVQEAVRAGRRRRGSVEERELMEELEEHSGIEKVIRDLENQIDPSDDIFGVTKYESRASRLSIRHSKSLGRDSSERIPLSHLNFVEVLRIREKNRIAREGDDYMCQSEGSGSVSHRRTMRDSGLGGSMNIFRSVSKLKGIDERSEAFRVKDDANDGRSFANEPLMETDQCGDRPSLPVLFQQEQRNSTTEELELAHLFDLPPPTFGFGLYRKAIRQALRDATDHRKATQELIERERASRSGNHLPARQAVVSPTDGNGKLDAGDADRSDNKLATENEREFLRTVLQLDDKALDALKSAEFKQILDAVTPPFTPFLLSRNGRKNESKKPELTRKDESLYVDSGNGELSTRGMPRDVSRLRYEALASSSKKGAGQLTSVGTRSRSTEPGFPSGQRGQEQSVEELRAKARTRVGHSVEEKDRVSLGRFSPLLKKGGKNGIKQRQRYPISAEEETRNSQSEGEWDETTPSPTMCDAAGEKVDPLLLRMREVGRVQREDAVDALRAEVEDGGLDYGMLETESERRNRSVAEERAYEELANLWGTRQKPAQRRREERFGIREANSRRNEKKEDETESQEPFLVALDNKLKELAQEAKRESPKRNALRMEASLPKLSKRLLKPDPIVEGMKEARELERFLMQKKTRKQKSLDLRLRELELSALPSEAQPVNFMLKDVNVNRFASLNQARPKCLCERSFNYSDNGAITVFSELT